MTTAFPGAIDAFANPTPSTSQASARSHSQQHGDLNDAVEALQAKVGITGSTDPVSLEARLGSASSPTSAVGRIGIAEEKLAQRICLLDRIPSSEHAAILAGTSTLDVTTYVQAAVNDAITSRRALYAPGEYRLTATINITGSLTLHGDGCEMQIGALGDVQTRGKGSWFHFDHTGIGFLLNDPANFRSGIVIDDVGTYRTQPATTGGSFTPTAHDYDFSVKACDALLRNVCLYNATKGVLHWAGGYGRLSIDRLRGQPLKEGVNINDSGDICRINGVHFWPFFSNSTAVRNYMAANAKAIILKDADNPRLTDIFTIGYGWALSCEPLAGTLAMPLKVQLSNFDFDNGGYGIQIAAGGSNGVTMLVSHGYILGVSTTGPANASNIDIGGNNNVVMIDNVGLDLPQDANIKVTGTGSIVRASNLSVGRWNYDGGASFGIDVATGNTLRLSSPPVVSPSAGTTTAVMGGAGTIGCSLGTGNATATTDASGFITVTHGLGIAPRVITAVCQSGSAYVVYPTTTRSATSFQVQIRDLAGAAVATTSVTFDWAAWF